MATYTYRETQAERDARRLEAYLEASRKVYITPGMAATIRRVRARR